MITIKSFEVNYFSENTYLLCGDTKEAVLIGCGCLRKREQKGVNDFVTQNGPTLKRYLCTHLHLGHTLGNEFVHNTYGLSLKAHKTGVEDLPPPEEQAKTFGLSMKARSVPVGKYLVNGEIIKFGRSELTMLGVSGHSPGGVASYNKKSGSTIVEDSLFTGSIDHTDLWGGSQDILLVAIKGKLLSLPDETMVYPGHDPETQIIDERLNNPYL